MGRKQLTVRQQSFLGYYLGADPELVGNATQSYMAAYPKSTEKSAGTAGPRLLENVVIQSQIVAFQEKLQEKMEITAETLLQDSIRMRDIAFGDTPFTVQEILKKKDKEGNQYVEVVDVEIRRLQPQMLGKALELMGRNCVVQAFKDNVEVSHVHYLEEVLNRRLKAEENAAAKRKLELVD